MEHVNQNGSKDEEEVDKNPEGKSCYTNRNLKSPRSLQLVVIPGVEHWINDNANSHLRAGGDCGDEKCSQREKECDQQSHSSRNNLEDKKDVSCIFLISAW